MVAHTSGSAKERHSTGGGVGGVRHWCRAGHALPGGVGATTRRRRSRCGGPGGWCVVVDQVGGVLLWTRWVVCCGDETPAWPI